MKIIQLFSDSLDVLEELSDEQAGKLFKATYAHSKDEEVLLTGILKAVFIPIRNDLTRFKDAYFSKCEKNKANGKKGGRPKANETEINPTVNSETESKPSKGKEEDKDKDKDKEDIILSDNNIFLPTATNEKNLPHQYATWVCKFFDNERRKIQQNFRRNENNAEYLLVQEFNNSNRTYEMYLDAIRWLYSGEKEAQFWRDSVNTIAGLIKNFNAIEMKYISKSKHGEDDAMMQRAIAYYRKQGMSDEAIEEGFRNGTL